MTGRKRSHRKKNFPSIAKEKEKRQKIPYKYLISSYSNLFHLFKFFRHCRKLIKIELMALESREDRQMNQDFAKAIGKRIQRIRKSRHYTQEELSEKCEISQNYLSSIERGRCFPRIDKLVGIINTLNCSADDIFCDVINKGYETHSNEISEKMVDLPKDVQNKIYRLFAYLIDLEKGSM